MFNNEKKLELIKLENYQKTLIERLDDLCRISDVYNQENGDHGYLEANNELEEAINRILKVKTDQVKASFLKNSEMIEYVTQMDYIKEMVDNIDTQKIAVHDVAASSEQMSHAIEEVAIYVQDSLVTTNNTISMSTESLQTINKSFVYINKSFDEITTVQDKMHTVVEDTKEIENIVNIINEVAEQTNLLSLNASIEAARAGEKGKGFAVVADEIKKLAENTKESANYIRKMIKKLRDEIGLSEDVIIAAVKIFSQGKDSINEATSSMNKIEAALKIIGDSFDGISANIEEQTATTQEISARLAEINNETSSLYDSCMQTGHGIYDFSELAEASRNIGKPWFKDFHGSDMYIGMIAEHLLWKWKVYNAVCGFIKIEEKNINDYTECSLGKLLEHLKNSNSNSPMLKLYDPHKNVHFYAKKIIRDVNKKDKNNIENDIKQLNTNMAILLDGLKNAKL